MIDKMKLETAIAYFEDAVRESDEIMPECSPALQEELTEQKAHFVVALEALRRTAEDDKAREEGRLVVLPESRKPLVWGDDDHDSVLCPDCGEDLMGIPYGERMVLQCPECGQYLDATMENVLTRQEAEAALGGGEGDI